LGKVNKYNLFEFKSKTAMHTTSALTGKNFKPFAAENEKLGLFGN
jgi:hypothetical protein